MVIIVMETIKNAALAENTGWHRVTLSLHESYGHQTVLTVTNMQWSKGCSALQTVVSKGCSGFSSIL